MSTATATATKVAMTVDRAEFSDAVNYAAKAVSKPLRPAYAAVGISLADGQLTIRGSDIPKHRSVTMTVDSDASFAEVAIPATLFTQVLGKAKGETLGLTFTDDQVVVKVGRRTHELRTMNAEDLAPIATINGDDAVRVTVAAPVLADILKRTYTCASSDATKPISGVQIACNGTAIRAAATDSYRLAYAAGPVSAGDEASALVSAALLADLARDLATVDGDVDVIFSDSRFSVHMGSHFESLQLHSGAFPTIDKLLTVDGVTQVKIADPREMIDEVEAISLTATQSSSGAMVTVELDEEEALASAASREAGGTKGFLPVEVEGDDITATFASDYLITGLKLAGARQVVWHLAAPLKPTLIDGGVVDGISFKYLLIPARV